MKNDTKTRGDYMTIQEQITLLKTRIYLRELSDDGYYLSLQYKEDERLLNILEQKASTFSK